jgi:adenylate cyclase
MGIAFARLYESTQPVFGAQYMIEHAAPKDHPLESIVRRISPSNPESENEPRMEQTNKAPEPFSPTLSPSSIKAPALLIDRKLKVVWQNKAAGTELWHLTAGRSRISAGMDIFDLLLDPEFQSKVTNWRQWTAFFVQHAIGLASIEYVKEQVAKRDEREHEVLQSMLDEPALSYSRDVFSGRLRQVHANGMIASYWVVATDFTEGRLLVFDNASSAAAETGMARAAEIEQRLETVRQHPQPVQMPIHILAARLNNSETLQTEMLSEEYSRLLQRLWHSAIEIIENFGGIFGPHTNSGLLGFFVPVAHAEYNPMHVIECALELKTKMVELGREWKIRKGWLHELELNIGIHSADELLGTVRSSLGDGLATFGRTLRIATRLSDLSPQGQIWVTKELINRLAPKAMKNLRFGVFRTDNNRQVFVSRCFSRIRDLSTLPPLKDDLDAELGAVAVTQLFDRQRQ